jgi:hypothetical protein
MRKTIKFILMFLFSLVASPAWSDVGDVDTEGYSMVLPNQTSTIRVQDVQVTNVVEEGTRCPENGRQARDAEGAPLFCQSGVWKGQRPIRTVTVTGGRSCYQTPAYATCPTGTTLVGGGYAIAGQEHGTSGTNSPDVSKPFDSASWVVVAGGYPDYCFDAFAVCAQ